MLDGATVHGCVQDVSEVKTTYEKFEARCVLCLKAGMGTRN